MFEVKRTEAFDEWLKALKDRDGAALIDAPQKQPKLRNRHEDRRCLWRAPHSQAA
jgi:putative component of toxin-antitoxin plasmid stabilization module